MNDIYRYIRAGVLASHPDIIASCHARSVLAENRKFIPIVEIINMQLIYIDNLLFRSKSKEVSSQITILPYHFQYNKILNTFYILN